MPIPKAIRPQTLQGLTGPQYETSRQMIDAHNQLLASLGPGTSITPANFALMPSLGAGANVSATNGSFKRGNFTLKVGTAPTANPALTLGIPASEFGGQEPHIVLTQSGGTGTTPFGYSATAAAVTIKFIGTPSAADTYTFNFQMTD